MTNIRLPKRSRRYGVGKEIGGAVYVHRQYESVFGPAVHEARARIPAAFHYTVVKHAIRKGTFSFVACDDFDTNPEPTVGDIWVVPVEGEPKLYPQQTDPFIYHHKWLMVAEDYEGFDVAQSFGRSELHLVLNEIDMSRIGRLHYWLRHVMTHV
jgi:hypothetical protein